MTAPLGDRGLTTAHQGGRYVLTSDELAALAGLLGSHVLIGARLGAPPNETKGIEDLRARGLVTQVTEGTLAITDELRLCVETVTGFEALLSCTGRDGHGSVPVLGIYLLTGTIVALRQREKELHELVWLPVLPVAVGAVAGYAEALERGDGMAGPAVSIPVADLSGFQVALTEGREDVLGDVLQQGGLQPALASALAAEAAHGSVRRFVGTSAFHSLDDLDVAFVVVKEQEYAMSVLDGRLEVTAVDSVKANHLVAYWLAHAYAQSLSGPGEIAR